MMSSTNVPYQVLDKKHASCEPMVILTPETHHRENVSVIRSEVNNVSPSIRYRRGAKYGSRKGKQKFAG